MHQVKVVVVLVRSTAELLVHLLHLIVDVDVATLANEVLLEVIVSLRRTILVPRVEALLRCASVWRWALVEVLAHGSLGWVGLRVELLHDQLLVGGSLAIQALVVVL